MFKILIQKLKYLRKHKFSVLADYGDLSKYNYEQMCIILAKWNKKIINEDKYFDVEWESSNTRIIIRYNKITRYYIQIIEEEWKPLKLIFKKSDLIS